MRAPRILGTFALLSAAIGWGCMGQPAQGPAVAPSGSHLDCAGTETLIVTNNTRTDLEIVEVLRGTSRVMAHVSSGAQTIVVPAQGARYAARSFGQEGYVAWESAYRASGLVRFRRVCKLEDQ